MLSAIRLHVGRQPPSSRPMGVRCRAGQARRRRRPPHVRRASELCTAGAGGRRVLNWQPSVVCCAPTTLAPSIPELGCSQQMACSRCGRWRRRWQRHSGGRASRALGAPVSGHSARAPPRPGQQRRIGRASAQGEARLGSASLGLREALAARQAPGGHASGPPDGNGLLSRPRAACLAPRSKPSLAANGLPAALGHACATGLCSSRRPRPAGGPSGVPCADANFAAPRTLHRPSPPAPPPADDAPQATL